MEAPRWRLINAHYLNVPELPDGTRVEWEYKETARETGRQVRKLFSVPILLNPADAADCNYPGELIVAHEPGEGQSNTNRRDYIFLGEPTPEMEPLNEAAQAISDSLRQKWEHPIESLGINGSMSPAEQAFMDNLMKAFAGQAHANNQSVPKDQFDALKKELDDIKAMLTAKPTPEAAARRV